jgi:hypothetical protein
MNACKGLEKILIMTVLRGKKKWEQIVLLRDMIVVWVKNKMTKLIPLQDKKI